MTKEANERPEDWELAFAFLVGFGIFITGLALGAMFPEVVRLILPIEILESVL